MTSLNTSNFSNSTNMPALPIEVMILSEINSAIKMYVLRIISGFGIALNILSMIICFNKKLTNHFYSLLWCRSLINGAVCLFGVSFLQLSAPPVPQSYALAFATVFIINLPMRITFFVSAVSELLLIMNRLYVIENKTNFFSKMSKISNLVFCFLVSIPCSLPTWIGLQIREFPGVKNMYMWDLTEFGKSVFFQYYQIAIFFMESVIPVFTLLILNIYTMRMLQNYLNRKAAMTGKKTETERKKKFTRIMIALVSLSILVRTIDMIAGIFIRLKVISSLKLTPVTSAIIDLGGSLSLLFMMCHHSFECFIYFHMDSNLNEIVAKMLGCYKVSFSIEF